MNGYSIRCSLFEISYFSPTLALDPDAERLNVQVNRHRVGTSAPIMIGDRNIVAKLQQQLARPIRVIVVEHPGAGGKVHRGESVFVVVVDDLEA
jgi:hypothetical protein